MRSLACLLPLLLLAGSAAAAEKDVALDINVFQGFRSTSPAGEPSPSSVVVLAPDAGWSSEIEKQRQQIAETLGLDGATLIGRVRAVVPSGSSKSIDFPREGKPALVVLVRPTLSAGKRVGLEIHLREKAVPETELANFSMSGDLGKAFIVGGKSGSEPLLVSVTPKDPAAPAVAGNGGEIHKVGGDVRPPVLVRKVEPKYPEKSRADKKSGIVALQVMVDEQGSVRNPVVVRHSEPEFESAALEAVRQWAYSPATLNGKPVPVYLTVSFSFNVR